MSASTVSPESSVPPPAKESSGSKPRKKKPRSSQAAEASSSAKSTSVKSAPAKSSPAKSTSVPGPPFSTYWEASRRTGFGYVLQDCTGDPVSPCLKWVVPAVSLLNTPKWRFLLLLLTPTVLEVPTNVWAYFNGCRLFLLSLMLCASRRYIV